MKKVVVANDHAALERADLIVKHLIDRGYEVTFFKLADGESADYPDQAEKAVEEYRKGGYEFGVLLCGTGIGISVAANKMDGIFCSLPQNKYAAEMTRRHNNPNFIAFGGRIDYQDDIIEMLDAFIDAEYEGGRHQRRIDKTFSLQGK